MATATENGPELAAAAQTNQTPLLAEEGNVPEIGGVHADGDAQRQEVDPEGSVQHPLGGLVVLKGSEDFVDHSSFTEAMTQFAMWMDVNRLAITWADWQRFAYVVALASTHQCARLGAEGDGPLFPSASTFCVELS